MVQMRRLFFTNSRYLRYTLFFSPCSSADIIQISHFSPTTLLVLTECAIKNEICVCTANPHFGSVLFHSGEKENRIGRSLET